MTPEQKIKAALDMAEYGSIDGAHHKMWVIDQMVRLLTGNSDEYYSWVANFNNGEEGQDTYEWEIGIAP